jgi:hypothetical protein
MNSNYSDSAHSAHNNNSHSDGGNLSLWESFVENKTTNTAGREGKQQNNFAKKRFLTFQSDDDDNREMRKVRRNCTRVVRVVRGQASLLCCIHVVLLCACVCVRVV